MEVAVSASCARMLRGREARDKLSWQGCWIKSPLRKAALTGKRKMPAILTINRRPPLGVAELFSSLRMVPLGPCAAWSTTKVLPVAITPCRMKGTTL